MKHTSPALQETSLVSRQRHDRQKRLLDQLDGFTNIEKRMIEAAFSSIKAELKEESAKCIEKAKASEFN